MFYQAIIFEYLGFGVTVHYVFNTQKNERVEINIGCCY